MAIARVMRWTLTVAALTAPLSANAAVCQVDPYFPEYLSLVGYPSITSISPTSLVAKPTPATLTVSWSILGCGVSLNEYRNDIGFYFQKPSPTDPTVLLAKVVPDTISIDEPDMFEISGTDDLTVPINQLDYIGIAFLSLGALNGEGSFFSPDYSIQINPPPRPGAVPEPATWAMMIAGFGAIGAGMRRRVAILRTA